MENTKNLLEKLELVAVDIRRVGDDLDRTIKYIERVSTGKEDTYFDKDELIGLAINGRIKKLREYKTLIKLEKQLWKQLKQQMEIES